jgi:hypothetical protein
MIGAMTPLEQLVTNRLAELGDDRGPLSFRRAAERSGGLVSHQMLQFIATGRGSEQYSERVLKGIALAIDVPLSKVQEAAAETPHMREFRLPEKSANLTAKDRRAVEAMVNALLDAHDRQGVDDPCPHCGRGSAPPR